jgi:type IV secretory pathway TraG/TraD family ATPase VirD4
MLANDSTKFRLDPPLLLALDEIGNLAPLPSLPLLMAEGGGSGITAMPVLQSLAQARTQWGQDKAGIIWGASIVKIVLGGLAEAKDLTDLRIMFGERDEETENVSMDHYGNKSYQRSLRKVPILPEDTIRTMPFGTGIVMLRSTRPMITDLRKWTERPDAAQLEADANDVESLIRNASKRPVVPPRT